MTPPTRRIHVVLVPGFVGFDALGQLEYYAGTEAVFDTWLRGQAKDSPARRVVLHYFDNLPTAAVATRAERLRRFLSVRISRGHIKAEDEVVLIGHSTGGLDIRHLIRSLTDARYRPPSASPGEITLWTRLRKQIKRVVFISVPHRGTNIANWVDGQTGLRQAIIASARGFVETKDLPGIGELVGTVVPQTTRLELGLEQHLPGDPRTFDFILAAQDALQESNDRASFAADPILAARAREAQGNLEVWLDQMQDFAAISDLAVGGEAVFGKKSPAHFDAKERDAERDDWAKPRIDVRSYVTRTPSPFDADLLSKNKPWRLTWPPSYPCFSHDDHAADTDLIYWSAYRACCAGPFRSPKQQPMLRLVDGGEVVETPLESWENDAVVNSASMLWQSGDNFLVTADHADIIGHHTRRECLPGSRPGPEVRRFSAYDFFRSGSGFGAKGFERIWRELFAFAAGS